MKDEDFNGCMSCGKENTVSIDLSTLTKSECIDDRSKFDRPKVECKTTVVGRYELQFLQNREVQPELMDQPELNPTEHQAALVGLHRVNIVSGVALMMWWNLKRLAETYSADRPMRVLDVACGGGDVAIQLAIWAQASGINMEIHGCDFSTRAIRYAQGSARERKLPGIRFFQLDVLSDPFPDGFDVIICSLFLHHLKDVDAEMVLRKMAAAARRAVLVDDLLRSYLGFLFCWIGSRLLSRCRIVHLDGLQSVRAAFTFNEVQSLAHRSGLEGARFQRRWPERFFMNWNLE